MCGALLYNGIDPEKNVSFETQLNETIKNNNSALIQIIEQYYKSMIRQNLKINKNMVGSIKFNKDFKKENDKLNSMASDNSVPISQVVSQRKIVEAVISDTNIKNEIITNFTQGLSSSGQIASGIASLCGRPKEASDIGAICNASVQGTLIGSAFFGIGPLVGLNPAVLGLMAASSIIGLAGSLLSKGSASPYPGLFSAINGLYQYLAGLKEYLVANFDKLFIRLDKMERTLLKEILTNRNIQYDILTKVDELCRKSVIQWAISNDSVSCADEKLNDIKTLIENVEARTLIGNIGQFISTVFHNEDHGLYTTYRNQLIGHLINPFGSSNSSIVGLECSSVMDPKLNLESIIKACGIKVLSNEKKDEYFKSINTKVDTYVPKIINVSQFMLSRPKNKDVITDCTTFETYFNVYKSGCLYSVGIFTIDAEDSTLILKFDKTTKYCVCYEIGVIPLYLVCKLVGLGDYIRPYEIKTIKITSYQQNEIITLTSNLITGKSDKIEPSDISKTNIILNGLYDVKTTTSHPLIYQSLYRTLLYIMAKEYIPVTSDDSKLTRIASNEMNQLFQATQHIQQNYMKIKELCKISHIKKLVDDCVKAKDNFIVEFKKDFGTNMTKYFDKLYNDFISNIIVKNATVTNFDIDLDVGLNNPILGTGHEDYYNDRHGYSRNGVSGYSNGEWGNCVNQIRTCAHQIMSAHIQYVNSEIEMMRTNKKSQWLKDMVVYFDKPTTVKSMPFYIYPETKTGVILPLTKEFRERLIETLAKDNTYLYICQLSYFGKCVISAEYTVGDTFQINLYVNSLTGKTTNTKFYSTKPIPFTNTKFYSTKPIPFSLHYNGYNLNLSDGLWTWFCGGLVASGTRYDNIENWQSHIAGNHSHKYAHVPVSGMRQSILESDQTSFYQQGNVINVVSSLSGALRPVLVIKDYIKMGIKDTFVSYNTGNKYSQFYIKLDKYFECIKKIETWDYWTYSQLGTTLSSIFKSKSDIMRLQADGEIEKIMLESLDPTKPISEPKPHYKECITDGFYSRFITENTFKDYFISLQTSEPVAGIYYKDCLKEINGLVEMFAPYIERGLSTPEIAKMMGESIQKSLRKTYLLMNTIREFKKMSPEEQSERIGEFVEGLESSVENMIPILSNSSSTTRLK